MGKLLNTRLTNEQRLANKNARREKKLLTINMQDVETIDKKTLIAEASTLGLSPNEWPFVVRIRGSNGLWIKYLEDISNGDLLGVIYRDANSRIELHIMND